MRISQSNTIGKTQPVLGRAAKYLSIGVYLGTASIAALLSASPVRAATELGAGVIEEVVVTARRKEENLQGVPVAVTSLSDSALRRQSIVKVEDLQRAVPGLVATPSVRGSNTPLYMIRGQRGALNPTSLTDPAVAVYFNEFNLSRAVGTNQTMFDLDSVQVLKGPQGTLFGRNSTGGAILITSKAPRDVFEGYAQASAGDYNLRDFEGALNVPLGSKASLRVAGKVSKRDGYLTNVLTGQKADDLDAQAYRVSLKLTPTDELQSTFVAQYFHSSGVGAAMKIQHVEPSLAPAVGAFTPILANALRTELAATQALGKYQFRNVQNLYARDLTRSVQNTTSYDLGQHGALGNLTVKNIAGYRTVSDAGVQDFFGGGADLFKVDGTLFNREFSEEFQIQGKSGNLDYIAGLYYFRESAHETGVGRQLGLLAAIVPAAFPVFQNYDYNTKNTSYAAFAHADYKLDAVAEGLSLSGGLRWTTDKHTVVWHNLIPTSPARTAWLCQMTGVIQAAYDTKICATSAAQESRKVSWDVSVNYQATPTMLLYAAHRSAFRSGGFNQTPLPGIPTSFDPEYVKDLEIGLKAEFNLGGMPARFNAAGYYQWYRDIQRGFSVRLPSGGTSSLTTNVARAHIAGAEAELTLKPTSDLDLMATFTLTKPAYDKWIDDYFTAGVAQHVDVHDSKFAWIPERQLGLLGSYRLPLPESAGQVSVTLSYYWQSGFETTDVNSRNCGPDGLYRFCLNYKGRLPGYSYANFRADWTNVGQRGFDVSLFVNNITNKFYMPWATNAIGTIGDQAAAVGAPRMWGVQVRVPFGGSAY